MNKHNENFKLCILHTNDTHSYLDDFARRAYLVDKIRAENHANGIETLLVDSGDVFAGNIYFIMYEGQKEGELMTKLGYDVMTLGNHEFDRGSEVLANFIDIIDFPVVSTNIDMSQDDDLKTFTENGKILPYLIKENGIGILGLTTPDTVDNAAPSCETHFHNPTEAAMKAIQAMKAQGASRIILLSHLGLVEDKLLAETIADIDVIIGAHSHTLLTEPLVINGTPIVQVGEYGRFLGKLTVEFSPVDGIIGTDYEVLSIGEAPESETFKPLIEDMKRERAKVSAKIIGEAGTYLDGKRRHLKVGETNLGNLVVDAFMAKAVEKGYNPDLAIINGKGIRSSIPEGTICFGATVNVLPFSTSLMILEATGSQIKESLQHGICPQVSGIKVTFSPTFSVTTLTGEKLDPTKKYTVATNTFIGYGKDNYHGFKTAKIIEESVELDVKLLADYIESLPQPIFYETDGRLIYPTLNS